MFQAGQDAGVTASYDANSTAHNTSVHHNATNKTATHNTSQCIAATSTEFDAFGKSHRAHGWRLYGCKRFLGRFNYRRALTLCLRRRRT